jgi:two-component system, NtrC family, sensor kinase
MRRRDKTAKTQRPKTLKRRNAPKVAHRRKPSAADAGKIALLEHKLNEALEQQTATSEILKVISGSPGHLEPVFNAMLEKAVRICEAKFGVLWLCENGGFRSVAQRNTPPAFAEHWRTHPVVHPVPGTGLRRLAETRQVAHIADMTEIQPYIDRDPFVVSSVELGDFRTVVNVPMLKESELVGAIAIYRQEVRPFTEKQIELVTNFAAQAVIAIENTRLLNELRQRTDDLSESLEQQTATSEVLKIISSSPADLTPVFEAMLENATRICAAKFGELWLREGDAFRLGALLGAPPAFAEARWREPVVHPGPNTGLGRIAVTKQPIHIADVRADQAYAERDPMRVILVELAGARAYVAVPMLKEDELIGTIAIYRQEVRSFTNKQIELVKNFAAQAVIAIENTRLLSELRESLQQQTATADVLKVISRSTFDLESVLNTLAASAARLCQADKGAIFQKEADMYRLAAHFGFSPEEEQQAKQFAHQHPLGPGRGSLVGRVALNGRVVHINDVLADREYQANVYQKAFGFRTNLGVPLLREGTVIGVFALMRTEVNSFSENEIDLVATFADQAVIAIENARLLNELRESLQQQTATADVLKVISRSTFDLHPVLDTLTESAARLCEADIAGIVRQKGETNYWATSYGLSAEQSEYLKNVPIGRDRGTVAGRVLMEGKTVHVADVLADPEYTYLKPQKLVGFRAALGVPLLREGSPIGIVLVMRRSPQPFNQKQIELVETFADQAVIAIENVRLFEEVQARTRDLSESLQQQTATADVLKVISRSTFDLPTVLQTLIESAAKFCDADKVTVIREKKDGAFYRAESYGYSREYLDYVKDLPIAVEGGSAAGRALLEGRMIHIADVKADPKYTLIDVQKLGDYRTILAVPMLREKAAIGVLVLTRSDVRPFAEKQIELVTTFADQSAIAIENVRLFESVETRTRELAKSLEELHTTQDRLVQTQKLASLGQLTAGIAHEIKNPLNFVNNFSGVSVELIDELQQALAGANLDTKLRSEISEIAETLQGNLDKVVQHGKRADSIVKNMLLHSREGSGEHRPVDINALVEESLNLAYHGARAEKQGFNITLERSLDPTAGEADIFPQEITRALLNLISNGFYAATKRNAETNGGDYEPTLAARTKNLGDRVEITIRDNGTGIPPEVKEKIFNPFFTTKPAGEGTGLGLSISHDIIVKQHGGSIEVDTKSGEFTEIRIILPRGAMLPAERA